MKLTEIYWDENNNPRVEDDSIPPEVVAILNRIVIPDHSDWDSINFNNGVVNGDCCVKIPINWSDFKIPFGQISGFNLAGCTQITSLVGGPHTIGDPADVGSTSEYYVCVGTSITSLEGIASRITGSLDIRDCKELKTLSGIQKHIKTLGNIMCDGTIANVLSLFLIEDFRGLVAVDPFKYQNQTWAYIVSQHLNNMREHNIPKKQAILMCQRALIDAGYADQAKL